jgi:hypothetical protein
MPIRRTTKANVDTDGDHTSDVIFSVIPEEPVRVGHANEAVYQLQVENQRPGADLKFRRRETDANGADYYVEMPLVVRPGETLTLETLRLRDTGDRHPVANPRFLSTKTKYMLMVANESGHPVEIEVKAECHDDGRTSSVPESLSGGER